MSSEYFLVSGLPAPVASSGGRRPRSRRRGDTLEYGDLLPDLAREARRQRFNLVHRAKNDRIVEILNEQGGDFAGDGQELAAIVEIPSQLGGIHGARRG